MTRRIAALASAGLLVLATGACTIEAPNNSTGPGDETGDGSGSDTGSSTGSTNGDGTGTETGEGSGTETDTGTETGAETDNGTDTFAVCSEEEPCDDSNPCTDDSCVDGQCNFDPNDDACDDANECTQTDWCQGGACVGGDPLECDDGVECSVDECVQGQGCVVDWDPCGCIEDDDCDDGDPCTGVESCADNNTCMAGEAVDCDDGFPCTNDLCAKTSVDEWVCEHEVKLGQCYVDDACFNDGDPAPGLPCAACDAYEDAIAFTTLADGQPCTGSVGVCLEGVCKQIPPTMPQGMVWIPSGTFMMGCTASNPSCWLGDEPAHQVKLSGYAIDKTEVTVGTWATCVAGGSCKPPKTGGAYATWDLGDDYPVNYVSWEQASELCDWAGRRLCTEAEWEKAARGTDIRTYPWGEAKANCTHAVMSEGGHGCGTNAPLPVGSKPEGASPWGALDMAGNLWEFVADYYDEDYYAISPSEDPTGPTTGSAHVLRGGSFKGSFTDMYVYKRQFADSEHDARGVRCCWSP